MHRDYRDVGAGAVLILTGLFVAGYVYFNYDLGTVLRMGPGMYPMGAGFILAILGVLIAIPAIWRPRVSVTIQWRPLLIICLGIIAFALSVDSVGLVPAIVALVVISSLADERPKLIRIATLSVVLCALAVLIFRVILNLPLVLIRVPF